MIILTYIAFGPTPPMRRATMPFGFRASSDTILCPAYKACSQVDCLRRKQGLVDIIFRTKYVSTCQNILQFLAVRRLDGDPIVAVDHHAVTGELKVSRDADDLALVVSEKFGFARRDSSLTMRHPRLSERRRAIRFAARKMLHCQKNRHVRPCAFFQHDPLTICP